MADTKTSRPAVTAQLPAYPALAPTRYSAEYGGIPGTPNPLATAAEAVRGNIELLPDLKALGRQTNRALLNQYTSRLPGYSDMANQSSANIASMLRGEVPADVRYALEQGAAERGVGRGMAGADITNLEYLRGLGLTSLGLQKEGEQSFTGAMGRIANIPFFDYSRLMVSPEQQQEAGMHAATLAAAPAPAYAERAKLRNTQAGLRAGMYGGPGSDITGQPAWGTPVRSGIVPTDIYGNPLMPY